MRAVRNLFNWMEDTQAIFTNPADRMVVPNPGRKLMPVPTEAEIKRLLARPNVTTPVGIRDRAIIETGYCCGLRREELASLTIFDPDLDTASLRVMGKGRKERALPLGRHALHWLKQYMLQARPKLAGERLDIDALWLKPGGKALSSAGLSIRIKHYAREAKLKRSITPHSLRRACATHMLHHGAHPVQIQMLLGHANMQHLSQYLRLTITDIKKIHAQSSPGK
jgi:integrase/recombinase XerD